MRLSRTVLGESGGEVALRYLTVARAYDLRYPLEDEISLFLDTYGIHDSIIDTDTLERISIHS